MHGNSYCSLKAPSRPQDRVGFGPKFCGTDGRPTLDPENQQNSFRHLNTSAPALGVVDLGANPSSAAKQLGQPPPRLVASERFERLYCEAYLPSPTPIQGVLSVPATSRGADSEGNPASELRANSECVAFCLTLVIRCRSRRNHFRCHAL